MISDVAAVDLDRITVVFGGLRAVDGVSMMVARGERVAIIGPNGAGKTTLFRCISGEVKLTSGRIELFGVNVTGKAPYQLARLGLGRTYQVTNLFSELAVEDNAAIAAQGTSRSRFRSWWPFRFQGVMGDRIGRALEQVGLSGLRTRIVEELSHGEQRQLELAVALASEPEVLLLDEPAAGLSASERRTMRELIDGLPDDLTILLIEHDMDLALELVDRVVCLHNGSVIAEGSPGEIRENETVQAVYLGSGT